MVRRFRPGDGPGVERVHRRALETAGTDPTDVPASTDVRLVGSVYLDAGGEFLVAEREGRIVACGGLLVDGHAAELRRVAVDPDHQRTGLGTEILTGLERAARDRGCERVTLTTARRQASALPFYRAHDYERLGSRSVRGYDLVDLEKSL